MFKLIIIIVSIINFVANSSQFNFTNKGFLPETYAKLAQRHGYPMEGHETKTEDGYILRIYLMGQKGAGKFKSKTVLLSHGLLASSDCWFENDPESILPFRLYDQGYNVMLGNFRGTTHSMAHTTLSPNSSQFWNWSLDELGQLDVAAMIDYTLDILKQEKLILIGHSMATTTAFVLLSERPEYNKKLYKFIALAPSVFQFHSFSLARRWLAPFFSIPRFHRLLLDNVPHTIFPPGLKSLEQWRERCAAIIIKKSNSTFSPDEKKRAEGCKRTVKHLGIDVAKVGQEGCETMFSVPIESSSTKTLVHYIQNMRSNYFRRFDEGRVQNLIKYGQQLPPDYNLTRITCPVYLIWSPHDEFATKQDVATLVQKLSSSQLKVFEIKKQPWNHFEYILSKSGGHYTNQLILRSINSIK